MRHGAGRRHVADRRNHDRMSEHRASLHRVVEASAGTGKTHALATRYVAAGLGDLETARQTGRQPMLHGILASTFTRKAAGEIMERILERLLDARVNHKALAQLQQDVRADIGDDIARLVTPERLTDLLRRLVRDLHRLNVLTIDAFLVRLAGLFALETGLHWPPAFLEDDGEGDRLRLEALEAAVAGADEEEIFRLLEALHGERLVPDVYGALLGLMREGYAAFLATSDRPGAWETAQPASTPLPDLRLAQAVEQLRGVPIPRNQNGTRCKRWCRAVEVACDAARQGDWDRFLEQGIVARIVAGATTYNRHRITPAVREIFAPLIAHAGAILLRRHAARNRAAWSLLRQFHEAYRRLKQRRGMYEFEDMARLLLEAQVVPEASEAGSGGGLEEIYYRVDGRLRHVLLDEFQDTSLLQFRVLEPILDEILASDDGRSVFCVGDVKQCLYAWRDAEPALLPGLKARWPVLHPMPLHVNRRSAPVIIEAVNRVFGTLPCNAALAEHGAVAARWGSGFVRHRAHRQLPGAVRLIVAPARENREARVLPALRLAVERVREIRAAHPDAAIAVLLRRNRHIARLIHDLRAVGIEASEEGGSPLVDAPPVAVALALIHVAEHPHDRAAAYLVATSPLRSVIGLAPDHAADGARWNRAWCARVARTVRRRLADEGYEAFLRWVFCQCAGDMSPRDVERFGHMLDAARRFDARPGGRPEQFVQMVLSSTIEDPTRQQVRVMTIHRAKGLQFDAVILPELGERWGLRSGAVLVDRPDPWSAPRAVSLYARESLRRLDAPLDQMHRRALEREIEQELCCLYVGMTRARHTLEMIVSAETRNELSAERVVCEALAPHADRQPGAVLWEMEDRSGTGGEGARKDEPVRASAASGMVEAGRPAVTLRLGAAAERVVKRRPRVSPSALTRGPDVRAGDVFGTRGETGRDEGALLHAWLSAIEWHEDQRVLDEAAMLEVARQAGFDFQQARACLPVLRRLLSGPMAALLSRQRYADWPGTVRVRREWAFATLLTEPDGRVLEVAGRMDRVVVACDSGGRVLRAEVVEFKGDRLEAGDPLAVARLVQHYAPQVRGYGRALEVMYGLASANVTLTLAFVRPGWIVPVSSDTVTEPSSLRRRPGGSR